MRASPASKPQNRIAFPAMTRRMQRQPAAAGAGMMAAPTEQGFSTWQAEGELGTARALQLTIVVTLAASVVLALIASQDSQPLLLLLLSVLSLLGTFFLFGLAAGHIRISERVTERDLLAALAEGVDDGMMISDQDGRPVYCNAHFQRLLGQTNSDQAVSIDVAFQAVPQAREAIYRLTRAASRGETWREDILVDDAVQTSSVQAKRRLRLSHKPFLVPGAEGDEAPLVLWTIADITSEHAQCVAQSRRLEQALAAYNEVPAGLLAVATDGTITQASDAFIRWIGLTPQDFERRVVKLSDLMSSDNLALLDVSTRESGPDGAEVKLELQTDDGRRVPMTFAARRAADGSFLIAARNQELSERLLSAGTTNEHRFASFFQSAPFGIATVGKDGCISSANAAFGRMILDGTNGIGSNAKDVLSRAADREAALAINSALSGALGGKAQLVPVDITVGEDQQYSRRVYVTPVPHASESEEAAVLYVLDATEQKALEAKFAQSSKMEAVGKLAGGIAHDFNNVLTAILGFSDLLLQTHRPTDAAYKDIMNIRSSATRAAGLVAKLLAFSRRQTLQPEPLHIGEVVTDWGPVLKRTIGEKNELKILSGRDLWLVKTDKTQFEQLILNMVTNARDAMSDGGKVTIHTRNVTERDIQKLGHIAMPVGEYVMTEVTDTGSGMSPEVLAKIFEPFFTTKEVGKGTGLGLATVYGYIKQSGGFIYPESTPGKGTTFRIYLPRYVPAEAELAEQASKAQKKDRQRDLTGSGRVLLVEDEDVVRNFAARALKRQGYEILEATTGAEALEVMAEVNGEVDIIVSDVVMPEMDGPTLLRELRKTKPDIKVIFVSGYPHEAFENSLDQDSKFAFLAKPFSLPQLAAKVKEELGN